MTLSTQAVLIFTTSLALAAPASPTFGRLDAATTGTIVHHRQTPNQYPAAPTCRPESNQGAHQCEPRLAVSDRAPPKPQTRQRNLGDQKIVITAMRSYGFAVGSTLSGKEGVIHDDRRSLAVDAGELARLIRLGRVSSREATESYLCVLMP